MAVVQELAGILLPVFLLGLIGFFWQRRYGNFQREFVTSTVMNLGAPCLIIDTVAGIDFEASQFWRMLLAAFVTLVTTAVVGGALLRLCKLPLRSFLPPLVFPNAGNMGLPICLFAFGERGLALAIAYYLVSAVMQFTLAPLFQASGRPLETLLRTPVIYAAAIGLGLLAGGWELTPALGRTIELIGQVAIPLMLLAMGAALAGFQLAKVPLATALGVARLAIGIAIGIAVAWLLELEPVAASVLILQSAMPAAIFNYLLAARYGRHPDEVAGSILISTALSLLVLPILLTWLLFA